jgi:hypothetical protein
VIITFDGGILVRATKRSNGPARRVIDIVAGDPAHIIALSLSDPHDDPVLYTQVAAGSDVLCVRDRDFCASNVLSFCERNDIRVMDEIQLRGTLKEL